MVRPRSERGCLFPKPGRESATRSGLRARKPGRESMTRSGLHARGAWGVERGVSSLQRSCGS